MLFLSALLGLSTASATDILVLDGNPKNSTATAVAAQLEDSKVYDYTVTVLEPSDISSVKDLTGYAAVLFGDSGYGDTDLYDTVLIGLLADYQDLGGGVIVSSWMAYLNYNSIDDISPTSGSNSSYCSGSTTLTVDSKHEITDGITSFTDTSNYTETPASIKKDAEVLVSADCNGNGAVIIYETATARQVYLGSLYFGVVSSYNNTGLRSGDADTLLEQAVAWVAGCEDADGDGISVCADDCDDDDASSYPGAKELCDGVDNDCDGLLTGNEIDSDVDGFAACEGDCDDADVDSYPGAAELCDGLDNDCDGGLPDDEADLDGDGYAACAGDCADADNTISPSAEEVCDGIDNDCDKSADEGLETSTVYTDADGDGYGDEATAAESCDSPSGTVAVAGDCDDGNADAYPDAEEIAGNGVDEDCDGVDLEEVDDGKDDASTACTHASPQGSLGLGFLAALGLLAGAFRRQRG